MHPRPSTPHAPPFIARTRKSRTCKCLQVPASACQRLQVHRKSLLIGPSPPLFWRCPLACIFFWWVACLLLVWCGVVWCGVVWVWTVVRVRILYLVTPPHLPSSSSFPFFSLHHILFLCFSTFHSLFSSCLLSRLFFLLLSDQKTSHPFSCSGFSIYGTSSLTTVPTTVSPAHATKDTKTLTFFARNLVPRNELVLCESP